MNLIKLKLWKQFSKDYLIVRRAEGSGQKAVGGQKAEKNLSGGRH